MKQKSFIKPFTNVVKYVVFFAFLIGFFSVLITVFSTPSGKMPHVFGLSLVRINSGSMVEEGFDVNDVVFVNQKHNLNLEKGDIVAFYKKEDVYDKQKYNYSTVNNISTSSLVTFDEFDGQLATGVDYNNSRLTRQNLEGMNLPIYFHMIEEVYVAPDGVVFYQTIGSNPSASPDGLIRQDFIVAKYLKTPNFIKAIMSFVLTTQGIILLVLLPLSAITGYEAYGLLKRINVHLLEGRVFYRKISYKDPALKHHNITEIMSTPRKAYFWITSKKQEKEEVFSFLYGVNEKSNKKEIKQRQDALLAKDIFENKGALEYFKFWYQATSGRFEKKEILKMQNEYQEFLKESKKEL